MNVLFLSVLAINAILLILLAYFIARKRRSSPGGQILVGLLGAIAVWSVGYALELISATLVEKVFWAKIEYLGIVPVAPLMLIFVVLHTGRVKEIQMWQAWGLFVIPMITVLLAFTNESHYLLWNRVDMLETEHYKLLVLGHGLWFWVHVVYSYSLLTIATAMLLLLLRAPMRVGLQAIAITISALAPWAGNLFYLFNWGPFSYIDPTPYAFAVTGLVLGWAVIRLRLLDSEPEAKPLLIASLPEVMVLLNSGGPVIEFNQAAGEMLGLQKTDQGVRAEGEIVDTVLAMSMAPQRLDAPKQEITIGSGMPRRHFEIYQSAIYDHQQRLESCIFIFSDISARKWSELSLRMQYSIAETLSKAKSLFEAAPMIIEQICRGLDWQTGEIWEIGADGEDVQFVQVWPAPVLNADADMKGETRRHWGEGMAEVACKNNEPLLVADLRHDGRFGYYEGRKGAFCYPICLMDQVMGALAFLGTDMTAAEPVLGMFASISSQIGQFIHSKQAEAYLRISEQRYRDLFWDAKRQADELALLYQVRVAISRELELEPLFKRVVEAIAATYGYAMVSIYLLDGDTLQLQHQVGYEHETKVIPITRGVVGRVVRTGTGEYVADVSQDADFFTATEGIASEVCVPLVVHNVVVGILNTESSQRQMLSESDLRTMTALAEHVSIAIERARLYTSVRENQQQLSSMIENSEDGILSTDEFGRITEWNRGLEKITGINRRDAVGRFLWHIIFYLLKPDTLTVGHDDRLQRDCLAALEKGIVPPEAKVREYTFTRSDGTQRTIQMSIYPIRTSKGFMLGSISRDISDQAHLEQMKSDFINRAAHDLRTPLTTVTMMADLIQGGGSPEDIQQYWEIMNSELKRQLGLIEELLTVGRLESGRYKMTAHPVDLMRVLDDSLQAVQALAASKQINLITHLEEKVQAVKGDEASLKQVFVNLLNNAVKFTPADGTVELGFVEIGAGVQVTVMDTGIGIPPEDMKDLFSRFFRASNAIQNEIQGTGIGLYIVKSIVEQLGGTVMALSTVNQGTSFFVWLPYWTDPT